MKLSTTIGNYTVEVEGTDTEELISNMAEMSELLTAGEKCGKTKATDTILRKRTSGSYVFYEWFCPSAGTSLALGQTKAGAFFPKRKSKSGDYLDNSGWLTWQERKAMQDGGKPAAKNDDWEPGQDGGTPF